MVVEMDRTELVRANQWVIEPLNQWINESMNQWFNQWINDPLDEWSRWTNESMNHWVNDMNQWTKESMWTNSSMSHNESMIHSQSMSRWSVNQCVDGSSVPNTAQWSFALLPSRNPGPSAVPAGGPDNLQETDSNGSISNCMLVRKHSPPPPSSARNFCSTLAKLPRVPQWHVRPCLAFAFAQASTLCCYGLGAHWHCAHATPSALNVSFRSWEIQEKPSKG